MTRREELERIIIGTLLNSFGDANWYDSCKSCITEGMFSDERNRRIYSTIQRMKKDIFSDITPLDVINYDPSLSDLSVYMCELAGDWYFEIKKYYYNRKLLYSNVPNPKLTRVTFQDYITRFVTLVFTSK
jgi:hypothetical protein